jgi:L-lysine epsilon oxidase-like protein
MADSLYRIHPAIGIARVGNSEEYYLGPETAAGLPLPGQPDNPARGGLPIDPDTNAAITSRDLRDADGAFKRQAARFRIFQYDSGSVGRYPNGQGTEITIGSTVNGKTVKDIIWTVHVANKKANTYVLVETSPNAGIVSYENGKYPPIRNPQEGQDLNAPARVSRLTIDPGPRTISGASTGSVKFDQATTASYYKSGSGVTQLANYPKSFPTDSFKDLYCPTGAILTLGEIKTDKDGRLLVLGGYGRACGWGSSPTPLNHDVNNDYWFDDASDGPVSAVLVLDDGSVQPVQVGAWVTATDPGYAPQTLNVISLWDDMYDIWVRKLGLAPDIYDAAKQQFQASYKPPFDDHLLPIFQSVALQQWNINLDDFGIERHKRVGEITAATDPSTSVLHPITRYVRNPNDPSQFNKGPPLMPGSLGDSNEDFLIIRKTQYFFLEQWQAKNFTPGSGPALGPGEYLDKVVLQNCLGGRFSPGIDLTFIVRDPDLYVKDWATSGPFRIKPAPLAYDGVQPGVPLLTEGYVPLHTGNAGAEPGDISKFMALPWHTDYNSCATHPPTSNPVAGTTLYWSWPAQRPVAVYPAKLNPSGATKQLWSVRGPGTESPYPQNWGRYQDRINIILNWSRIGVVIQGSAIDGGTYGPDVYLEVASLLEDSGDPVQPFPNQYKPESS